ncbi:MAG: hypothetical protein KKA28_15040 [Planctomycetes bacterium]|nr:hypothetical protein [Planctomycetota bacterium]MCG2683504.1 hypothetical protein [Planctomycetales bacterium]
MQAFDLKSDCFKNAVRSMERRAERQIYEEKLVKCFVPNKVLEELDTNQNQLVFGRRGVGKTHTLKAYLGTKANSGELCHYLDCTAFGSGLGAEGSSKNIGIRFFSKLLLHLSDELLEDTILTERPDPGLHDDLENILARLSNLAVPQSGGETFNYLELIRLTNQFLDRFGAERLVILIDEWAQIPKLAQPFFAEFLKRSVFSNPRVTTKVGVVEYTYKLHDRVDDQVIGLERSADIFADVRMDRFFVWDEDQEFVERFFAEVLFNHLTIDLSMYLDMIANDKWDIILNQIFTQRRVLSELCRACEGNARDFLVLFGKAYAIFRQQTSHQKIGLDDVHVAAIDLYQGDKYSNISSEKPLEDFLDHLVHSIIKDKKSRTFMVPYQSRNHPLLSRLFSARILHPLNVEWSHPHNPGERYGLITMDYGTYASFRGTKSEPDQKVFWPTDDPETATKDDLVPLDDRRSIRRIVVDKSVLDDFWARMSG